MISPLRCEIDVKQEGTKELVSWHVYDARATDTLVYCQGGHHTRVVAQVREYARKKRLKGYLIRIPEEPCRALLDHVLVQLYGMGRIFMFRNCQCCQRALPEKRLIAALMTNGPGFCGAACKRLYRRWLGEI